MIYSFLYGKWKGQDNRCFITVNLYGKGCFLTRHPSNYDVDTAKSGLEGTSKLLISDEWQLFFVG